MKVVHVATTDAGSGAAIAAYRLHDSLRRAGTDSRMFVAAKRTDDATVVAFRAPSDPVSRVRRRARSWRLARSRERYQRAVGGAMGELLSDDRSAHGSDVLAQLPTADVINLHAMFDFIDYRAFFGQLPAKAAIVRTMHDMSFFTGGCHVAGACEKYTEQCGACPQLGSDDQRDLSRQIWQRKQAAFTAASGRLHIVAPSTWLAHETGRSSLLRDVPVSVIPFGIDTDTFRPMDRGWARDVFGISKETRVVLFVAEPVARPLKGFAAVTQALGKLRDPSNVLLVSVGGGRPPAGVGVPHLHLGHIGDERLLSVAYNTADVFVSASLQEAFGLTALEAMACGTPVIAYAVGGLIDTVRSGVTGLLVPARDVAALGAAIGEILEHPERLGQMALNSRRVALEEYTLRIQAERYTALYRAIVDGNPAVPSS